MKSLKSHFQVNGFTPFDSNEPVLIFIKSKISKLDDVELTIKKNIIQTYIQNIDLGLNQFIMGTNFHEKIFSLIALLDAPVPNHIWIRYSLLQSLVPFMNEIVADDKVSDYVLINSLLGAAEKNKDNIAFFCNIAGDIFYLRENYIEAYRQYSMAMSFNDISAYYKLININRLMDLNNNLTGIQRFNEIANKLGGVFKYKNYVAIDDCPELKLLKKISPKPVALKPAVGNNNHYALNSIKTTLNSIPNIHIYCLEKGHFSWDISKPGRPEYYVFDSTGRAVDKLCRGFSPFLEQTNLTLQNFAFIDDHYPTNNICHLWLDKIPRMMLMDSVNDYFLLESSTYLQDVKNILYTEKKFLKLNGVRGTIDLENCCFSDSSFENYYHALHRASSFCKSFIFDLNNRLSNHIISKKIQQVDHTKKVYISRSDASYRNLLNEEEFSKYLKEMGFTTLLMGQMSFEEQILAVSNATHIIGVHGAGLTNLIFSNLEPSVPRKIVELFPDTYGSSAYYLASQVCDFTYYFYKVGGSEKINHSTYSGVTNVTDNLEIDINDFDIFIRNVNFLS